jgi:(+)-trans-carveol dehydrogenase
MGPDKGKPMNRFDGMVAVITGAARGQRRNHAVRLAQEGADILAIDNCAAIPGVAYPPATTADLAQTVSLVEGFGRRAVSCQVDIRELPQLQQAVDDGVAALGRLDIVAANAGISSTFGPATELTEQSWNDMLDVSLTGAWHTVKATMPHLIAGGRGGAVIITSSAAGLVSCLAGIALCHRGDASDRRGLPGQVMAASPGNITGRR